VFVVSVYAQDVYVDSKSIECITMQSEKRTNCAVCMDGFEKRTRIYIEMSPYYETVCCYECLDVWYCTRFGYDQVMTVSNYPLTYCNQ